MLYDNCLHTDAMMLALDCNADKLDHSAFLLTFFLIINIFKIYTSNKLILSNIKKIKGENTFFYSNYVINNVKDEISRQINNIPVSVHKLAYISVNIPSGDIEIKTDVDLTDVLHKDKLKKQEKIDEIGRAHV